MKFASIGSHLLGFHKNNFEYMLCRRIGLTQRNIDGFVQTRCQLVCQAIYVTCRFTASIRNIQIWKDTVDVRTSFYTIGIGAEYTNHWDLSYIRWLLLLSVLWTNRSIDTHPRQKKIRNGKKLDTLTKFAFVVAYLFDGFGTKFGIACV